MAPSSFLLVESLSVRPLDGLPHGLTSRPLTLADARAVFEVMRDQELADTGAASIEEADIVGDWSVPGHDVGGSTVGVLDGDRLVAYAEHVRDDRADAAVHPAYRGRGIGTALARWVQDLARRRGARVVGMPVPQGSPADRLLEALGYHVRWTSWVLRLPPGATVPRRALPAGYAVRAATPQDLRSAWTVQEDAFLEWSVRDRVPFEHWHAEITGRPGWQPWQLRVVTDPAGAVVAMAWLVLGEGGAAFVNRLATRADQRGRGLGQALLVDAFAAAAAHGATSFELSTDSRTGALGLYQRVGMEIASTWVNRAVDLTPGGPPAPSSPRS